MNKTLTTAVLALCGSAIATVSSLAPTASTMPDAPAIPGPAIPGPGGVAIAVKAFLERQEAGKSTAPLLADIAHDLELRFDGDKLDQVKKGQESAPAFFDVGYDGKPFAARTAKQFVAQVQKRVASKDKDARVLGHEIGKIRANCQSAECSLAMVEFTRIYTVGGGKQMHVPMRATALMKYERTEGADFKIYHWHASPAR